MKLPHLLLCVGAQKSGTTWLYNRLADHAQTRLGSHKELHYFTTLYCGGLMGPTMKANAMRRMLKQHPQQVAKFIRAQVVEGAKMPREVHRVFRPMNDRWYVGSFDGKGRYAMDFTPEYAQLPDEGHDHIKRVSDHQKVMFVMREPLDRALSAVRYVFKQSGRDITTATQAQIMDVAKRPVILQLSLYDKTVATLERNYAAQDLRFMFYETMMQDKAGTLNGVCDWLDIARLDLPAKELEKRDNATETFALPKPVVAFLAEHLTPVRNAIEARFPEAGPAWADIKPS